MTNSIFLKCLLRALGYATIPTVLLFATSYMFLHDFGQKLGLSYESAFFGAGAASYAAFTGMALIILWAREIKLPE